MIKNKIPRHITKPKHENVNENYVQIFMIVYISVFPDCKDLIRKCLCLRPSDRVTIEEILEHPWMSESADMDMEDRCSLDQASTSSRESI